MAPNSCATFKAPSILRHATIDKEFGAGEMAAVIRGEEHHCLDELVAWLLLVQHLMYEGDGDRPFAHCRRNALDIASPDVTDRKHAW